MSNNKDKCKKMYQININKNILEIKKQGGKNELYNYM